jgi:hypothetical protein
MDVSEKRSAAEFCANVIARSDDRATTMPKKEQKVHKVHIPVAEQLKS